MFSYLNAPRCTTTAQQVRLYVYTGRGGVFVDHRPPREPGDPLHLQTYNNIQLHRWNFTSVQTFHTHTPCRPQGVFGAKEVKVRMKGEWGWDESEGEMKKYLTGTWGGERKRRGEEQTPTPTHLARSGETLKGIEKRKAEADRHGTRPAEGGKEGSAWTNLTQRNLRPPIGTHRTQPPNLPGEGRTHEIGDHMGN